MNCSLPVIDYPSCCAGPYTLAMGYIVNFQWFSKFIVSSSSPYLSFVQIQKMINCCSSWPARFYRILSFSVSSRVYEAYRKYTNSIRMHMGVISHMHTKGGKSLNSFGEIVYIYTRKLLYIYTHMFQLAPTLWNYCFVATLDSDHWVTCPRYGHSNNKPANKPCRQQTTLHTSSGEHDPLIKSIR